MSRPKILVVDDDIDYVESTATILEARGYEVIPAYNGKEGLEKARSELPQLIIIDLLMDTVNEGYDFCLAVRSDKRFEKVPLIMISSIHQNKTFKDVNFAPDRFWFPIDAFLDKPVDKETLLKHVSKLLRKSNSRGGASGSSG
jgi:two-component system alkaline phosphatase synthesis response regulator PhoP